MAGSICSGGLRAAISAGVLLLGVGLGFAQGAAAIDADDNGGVVTGPNGPEVGVWVIAETTDLPAK